MMHTFSFEEETDNDSWSQIPYTDVKLVLAKKRLGKDCQMNNEFKLKTGKLVPIFVGLLRREMTYHQVQKNGNE